MDTWGDDFGAASATFLKRRQWFGRTRWAFAEVYQRIRRKLFPFPEHDTVWRGLDEPIPVVRGRVGDRLSVAVPTDASSGIPWSYAAHYEVARRRDKREAVSQDGLPALPRGRRWVVGPYPFHIQTG